MKAAVLTAFNQLEIKEVARPVLKEGEALIKVLYAGMCGSDVHIFSGHHPTAKPPLILGHEFCGVIEEVKSADATGLKVGDRVVAQPILACNRCEMCVQGRENLCAALNVVGVHSDGCFAAYIKMPIRKIYRLNEATDLKLAALIEPLAVAVHDVRRSGLVAGQTAFIIGGGPIGILIALLAKLSGASQVVLSEPNEIRAALVEKFGFKVLNPTKIDLLAEVAKMTDSRGFDVVFEASGTGQGAALMTEVTKKGGVIVLVGFPKGPYPVDTGSIVTKELRVDGVRVHAQANFAAAVSLLESGTLDQPLRQLMTDEFALDEIGAAMDFSIADQKHLKVMLRMEE